MDWFVKHWDELTRDELYDLLAVRTAVFVVEQRCPYQEADGLDRRAWHVFARDGGGDNSGLPADSGAGERNRPDRPGTHGAPGDRPGPGADGAGHPGRLGKNRRPAHPPGGPVLRPGLL